jgi:hypothetical protein
MSFNHKLLADVKRFVEAAGATVVFEQAKHGSHHKAIIRHGGKSRYIIFATTNTFVLLSTLMPDIRRAFRDLGMPVHSAPEMATVRKPHKRRAPPPKAASSPTGPRYRPRFRSEVNALTAPLARLFGRSL